MGFLSGSKNEHQGRQINSYNIFVLLLLGFGSITYGYSASIIATTLGQPSFLKYYALETRPGGLSLESCTNGLFFAGGVIGPLLLPWVADKYGRRASIALAATLCLISGAIMAGSTNIGEFIVMRFVSGLGTMMMLAAIPLLMNEIVPNSMRGGLVELHSIFFILGYAIAAWVGFGFLFWKQGGVDDTWRPPLAIQSGFAVLTLIALIWVPESPRWLILQGRVEEAEVILNRLHSDPRDPDKAYAKAELYQIKKQIVIDRTLGNSWLDFIRKPSYRKRALIGMATCGFIQSSGDLVINNYGPTLYRLLGFSVVKQLLYPAAWLTFTLGVSVIAMPLIDRFPRNIYMATGLWGCMCCLIVEAALTAEFVPSHNTAALSAAVAMFFVFQIFDTAMLNAPEWAFLGEIFPTHIRAKGMCLSISMVSLTNVVYLQAAPVAFANIGWRYYLVFIILTFIGGFVFLFTFPDTRRLPLEEIAALFGDAHEVAIYHQEIEIDNETHMVVDHHNEFADEKDTGLQKE